MSPQAALLAAPCPPRPSRTRGSWESLGQLTQQHTVPAPQASLRLAARDLGGLSRWVFWVRHAACFEHGETPVLSLQRGLT